MLSINLRRCFLSIFYYLYTNIYFFRVFHAIFKTFRTKIEPRSFFVVFFTKWYSPCLLFLSSHKETAIPFTKEIAEYLKIYLVLKPWLFNNCSNLTWTYCSTTFTDSESKTLFHSDWVNKFNCDFYVITRHTHFYTIW